MSYRGINQVAPSLVFALLLLIPGVSQAQNTHSWASDASGTWNDANSWSPIEVPDVLDTAIIAIAGTAYVVTLDGNDTIAVFTLSSPDATFTASNRVFTVTGSADLSDGFVTWIDSDWVGPGTLTIGSDSKLLMREVSANAPFTVISAPLINEGELEARAAECRRPERS